jgi:GMP synthase (glutamine-hydrolysing)
MKPFLILQLRPDPAGDYEYQAFCKYGGLDPKDTVRIEMTEKSFAGLNIDDYSAVIVGGGPYCLSDKEKDETQVRVEKELNDLLQQIYEQDKPFLGACYGFGAGVKFLGGDVEKHKDYSEDVSAVDITLTEAAKNDPLTVDLPQTFRAFVGHKESCTKLPDGAELLAKSARCPNHMYRIKQNIYATQFHPELDVENMLVRIDVYKNAGYFDPSEVEAMRAMSMAETITIPMIIMKRFVDRYKSE